jgi:carboxypeptidase family protein/TonB-dependent receptor-like protein
MKKQSWFFLWMFLIPSMVYGQTGVVQGRIVDAAGSGQADLRVVVRDLADRIVTETTSNRRGEFSFVASYGEYRVIVAVPGAAPLRRIARVQSGITYLSIVTSVNGIPSGSNLNAVVLNEDFLRSLSEDQTEFSDMLRGTPRVPGLSGPFPAVIGGTELFVDGEPGSMPPVDQIREAWIGNDAFTAEYRMPGLLRIDLMTPVEQAALHGSATFNFRDESMNAAMPSGSRPPTQMRYLHGILNGPIVREKLFTSITGQRRTLEPSPFRIMAVTPTGTVSETIERPFTEQVFGTRTQYEISPRHRLNVHLQYASSSQNNLGVGGFSLQERASTEKDREWDLGMRETARLTSALSHELRFQVQRGSAETVPVTIGPSINVQGAFNGGGSGAIQSAASSTTYLLGNIVSWSRPTRVVRAGVQARYLDNHDESHSNPAGTFSFPNLQAYISGTPDTFRQTLGSTTTDVSDPSVAAFTQAEWAIRPRFSLSMGLRYEFQSEVDDLNNLDPRIGFAFRIQPSVALRGGGGVYHQFFPVEDMTTLSRRSEISTATIFNPGYPDPYASGTPLFVAQSTSPAQAASDLQNPYLIYGGVSIEKYFASDLVVSASYDILRGLHQIRRRNINAPFPGTVPPGTPQNVVNQMRPFFPITSAITQFESAGSFRTHGLSLRLRTGRLRLPAVSLQMTSGYTLGSSEDDNSIPANSYDLRAEWARSSFFPRHHLWSGVNAQAPWGISGAILANGRSALPYTVTMGIDMNADGNLADRPAGTSRNSEMGSRYFNVDARISKVIALPFKSGPDSNATLTVSLYARNLLNLTHHAEPSGVLSNPFFGVQPPVGPPRELEVGGKVSF